MTDIIPFPIPRLARSHEGDVNKLIEILRAELPPNAHPQLAANHLIDSLARMLATAAMGSDGERESVLARVRELIGAE